MSKSKSPLNDVMKIVKIVIHTLETSSSSSSQPAMMVKKLIKRGFKPEDIDLAMRWVASLGARVVNEEGGTVVAPENHLFQTKQGPGIRQLHTTEALKLSHDSQRMLLTLLSNRRITPLHFERTIEYLLQSPLREVSPERLEIILSLTNPTPGWEEGFFLSERVSPPQFIN
ncbi:DUF494 family protein [bacterium]|nr:DUF494 family protein [bacterium]